MSDHFDGPRMLAEQSSILQIYMPFPAQREQGIWLW